MMDEPLHLIVAFGAGMALGAGYLWSLWLVLQRLERSRRPGLVLLGSAGLRLCLLLAAWYWIAAGSWQALVACLLGFFVLRVAVTHTVRVRAKRPLAS